MVAVVESFAATNGLGSTTSVGMKNDATADNTNQLKIAFVTGNAMKVNKNDETFSYLV